MAFYLNPIFSNLPATQTVWNCFLLECRKQSAHEYWFAFWPLGVVTTAIGSLQRTTVNLSNYIHFLALKKVLGKKDCVLLTPGYGKKCIRRHGIDEGHVQENYSCVRLALLGSFIITAELGCFSRLEEERTEGRVKFLVTWNSEKLFSRYWFATAVCTAVIET